MRNNTAMSPRCYPPEPEFGLGRTAERRVWEVLREQLPDDAALLHSVAMIEGTAEYEADLVVAWPGVGVAVIEVKGGHVSRRGGQWYQSSRSDIHPVKDPVVQAQDCKHVLQAAARPARQRRRRPLGPSGGVPVHGYRSGLVVCRRRGACARVMAAC